MAKVVKSYQFLASRFQLLRSFERQEHLAALAVTGDLEQRIAGFQVEVTREV